MSYHCKQCFDRSNVRKAIVEETINKIKSLPWWRRLFNKIDV